MLRQHQNREGEEGARAAARDDPDGNLWGRNRRRDGEGEKVLPAADVRGRSRYCSDPLNYEDDVTPQLLPSDESSWVLFWKACRSFLLTPTDQSVHSISSKSMRSKSRKGWTCCRTLSSTSTHSASKTGFFLFIFFFFPKLWWNRSQLHVFSCFCSLVSSRTAWKLSTTWSLPLRNWPQISTRSAGAPDLVC